MINIYTPLLVGTDAEVFLRDRHTRQPIAVVGKLGGTKQEPLPIEGMGNGYAVQEDNVMAEFNVPPSDDANKFSESIGKVLAHLKKQMREHDLTLDISASAHFSPEQLASKQAQTFGCDPDICAWTDEYNEIFLGNPLLKTMRTAAAHIHVSYLLNGVCPTDYASRALAVRAHELFVGVPGILVDADTERRTIYGKAGAFRCTNYGHEYRTPSNFWIRSDKLRVWTFEQTIEALDFLNDWENVEILTKDNAIMEMIQNSINNHDTDAALFLCNEFQITLPPNE